MLDRDGQTVLRYRLNNLEAYELLASVWEHLQHADRAKEVLESAVARFPSSSDLRLRLGLVYKTLGATDSARQQLDLALRLNPKSNRADEIRRALERLGRAGTVTFLQTSDHTATEDIQEAIRAVVEAAARLSARQHGALIVIQRMDSLEQYIETGVQMRAHVTPELLLQIFYPDTPLHDGAVVIAKGRIVAAACVMPLSASGILNRSPERQMGLRHRAALGISEVSDAVSVVVSEQSGSISIAHAGRMIRRIDPERLENILTAFFRPDTTIPQRVWLRRFFPYLFRKDD